MYSKNWRIYFTVTNVHKWWLPTLATNSTVWLGFYANHRTVICFVLINPQTISSIFLLAKFCSPCLRSGHLCDRKWLFETALSGCCLRATLGGCFSRIPFCWAANHLVYCSLTYTLHLKPSFFKHNFIKCFIWKNQYIFCFASISVLASWLIWRLECSIHNLWLQFPGICSLQFKRFTLWPWQ